MTPSIHYTATKVFHIPNHPKNKTYISLNYFMVITIKKLVFSFRRENPFRHLPTQFLHDFLQ